MQMRKYFLFILMPIVSLQIIAQRYDPVNKNVSGGAKRVLNLLYDVKRKHMLFEQQNYNSHLNTSSDSAKAINGEQ